ncbi:MAG: DUF4411 family protein [Pseudomonadota bacterium]
MKVYCLDTGVLVEPWTKYYSMGKCPDYWELIDRLAKEGAIFCTEEVLREIEKVDDELKEWVQKHPHLFRKINGPVQLHVRSILERFPEMMNPIKGRSTADPWVVAHALADEAIVVTTEGPAPKKIKIPDVCNAFNVKWMDDHKFVDEIGIRFSASFKRK